MTKFGISEYIRNFWFNLCSILLLIVMMILTTGMISNIDEKAGMYKIARKYMDYDSMYLAAVEKQNIEELQDMGLNRLYHNPLFCYILYLSLVP